MTSGTGSARGDPFAVELAFTETYRRHRDDDPALREAYCLRSLLPHFLDPLQPGDLFAGRMHTLPVGFGLELSSGGTLYHCHADQILPQLAALPAGRRRKVEAMVEFWRTESTVEGRVLPAMDESLRADTGNSIADRMARVAGTTPDYGKLLRLGLPGLRVEITAARRANGALPLYAGMEMALDLAAEILLQYAAQTAGVTAATLRAVAERAPLTLREAIQLMWLFALLSGSLNYGRMDVYLGPFLAADLTAGRTSEAEASAMLQSLWRLIAARKTIYNSRVIVGGRGRPDEPAADRFALLAVDATRTVPETEPQLTLRFHEGMNPQLMDSALDLLATGRTFPILYNDEVNIPAVERALGTSRGEAEQYVPYGCGEYCIDHAGVGSPNGLLNLAKALEVALHRGVDRQTGRLIGLDPGDPAAFADFASLWDAYARQVEYSLERLADAHCIEVDAEAAHSPLLFASLLHDNCIARGKPLLGGGARFRGGLVETYGMVNAADSLTAIREAVFDRRVVSMERLLAALDADFAGFAEEERILRAAPKFGNDLPAADGILRRVAGHAGAHAGRQAARVGLDYFRIVNINNWMNVATGRQTLASADGRRAGKPLANGNAPTAGNDTSGVTALLNSMLQPDPALHAGFTQNLQFSRTLFAKQRPKARALLDAYFRGGGAQAMITVVGRGELEAALRDPDSYRNLIVRVGGFSAHFVELAPEVQQDLLARTLY